MHNCSPRPASSSARPCECCVRAMPSFARNPFGTNWPNIIFPKTPSRNDHPKIELEHAASAKAVAARHGGIAMAGRRDASGYELLAASAHHHPDYGDDHHQKARDRRADKEPFDPVHRHCPWSRRGILAPPPRLALSQVNQPAAAPLAGKQPSARQTTNCPSQIDAEVIRADRCSRGADRPCFFPLHATKFDSLTVN